MSDVVTVDAQLLRTLPLPLPDEGSKEHRGRVTVIGGSREVPGAVLLAATAAMRAGAGTLRIATVESRAGFLSLAMPEALVLGAPETGGGAIDKDCVATLIDRVERSDAILIGPGMVEEDEACALTSAILAGLSGPAFVLDAGALAQLSGWRDLLATHPDRIVITPHAGEMANLLGRSRDAVEADPLAVAREVAQDFQVVVVMKGAQTQIVAPNGHAFCFRGGGVGLATSGSGDTLAGFIAGFLARGVEAAHAAIWGVYVHGEAGQRLSRSVGPLGFLARELPAEAPRIMAEFDTEPIDRAK